MARFAAFKSLILTAFAGCVLSTHAEVRRDDDYLWRRARTLRSGQKVVSLQTSYQNFSERYADDGRVQPLGQPYTRALTWNRLKASTTEASVSAEISKYLSDNSMSGEEVAATSAYEVNRQEIGFGFNGAYGLSPSWMVGVLVPVRFVTVHARHNVQVQGSVATAMRERVRQLALAAGAGPGYDEIPEHRQSWELGDISLLNQFELVRGYAWVWSLQQQIRFPTARSQSVSEYITSPEDQGSVNLGFASLLDRHWKRGVVGLRFGYTAQLPDSVRIRGPNGSSVDPRANRDLGDWIWGALDGEIRLVRGFGLSAEHSFLSKGRDSYSGETFSREVYQGMGNHSGQQLQQSRLGMLYRIGSSGAPMGERWMATVDYTYPWIGKNSAEAAKTSLELINYF